MAFCQNCGAKLIANARFCDTCGTPVDIASEAADSSSFANPKISSHPAIDLKKVLIPVIFGIAFIAVLIVAFTFYKPSKYDAYNKSILIYEGSDDNIIVEPYGKSNIEIEGTLIDSKLSLDGTKAIVVVSNTTKSKYDKNFEGYSLYYVSDKISLISDAVLNAQLSLSGDGVAFSKEFDSSLLVSDLCLWNKGKQVTVTDSLNLGYNYLISPDGKNVIYTVGKTDDFSTEYYDGKSVVKLGKDMVPAGLANKAKYIYYSKNSALYVMKNADGNTKQKLGEDVYFNFFFNKDMSEIIFVSDEKTYISVKGNAKKSLSSSILESFILPNSSSNNNRNVIAADTFANTLWLNTNSDIVRVNSKFDTTSVAKKVENNVYLASNGKTLIYMKNDSIYKINALKENDDAVKLVNKITSYVAANNGNTVYYINDDAEVYSQKGTGKAVKIGDDCEIVSFGRFGVFKDKTLYYVSDGELCSSKGKSGKIVTGINDEILGVVSTPNRFFVLIKDGKTISSLHSYDGAKWNVMDTDHLTAIYN
ncbi:MAG: zinc ribbon domain-containing protein [Clostridiales bacterium]|jgi:hypothetical protein|nr:zinc ribbon domain-containing protein [Clostridiales bacterium]